MLNSKTETEKNNFINTESDQFIIFTLQDKEFGINVLESREIITVSDITAIPESPDFVKGVIDLRDQIIPIIDLNTILNTNGEMNSNQKTVIIISINNTLIGLRVNDVKEILKINPDNISKTPEITREVEKNYIQGVARINNRLLILIDIETMFSEKQIDELKNIG